MKLVGPRPTRSGISQVLLRWFAQIAVDILGGSVTLPPCSKAEIARGFCGEANEIQSHHKVVSVSITAAVVSHDNSNDESDRRIQRSMSTHHVVLPSLQYRPPRTERTNTTESSTTKDQSSYTRPVGPELVSIKQPSCTGLPPQWTVVHDRFIAYLATHAPLDRTGKVQRREESRERWRNDDITRLVMERFGELDGCVSAGFPSNTV